jgi:IMP and pyridine-specific 5'-nucleotidase
MCALVPTGHGSVKIKREALDELVLRLMDTLRQQRPQVDLPYCVFNGGSDAWLDVGNKSVGMAALQAYFGLPPQNCLHVGDQVSLNPFMFACIFIIFLQFLHTGNDHAARETCPCIWIVNPRETGKILQHVLTYMDLTPCTLSAAGSTSALKASASAAGFDIYTGHQAK